MMLQCGTYFQFIFPMTVIIPVYDLPPGRAAPARPSNRAALGAREKMFYDCKMHRHLPTCDYAVAPQCWN
jgi:hypothetical protein